MVPVPRVRITRNLVILSPDQELIRRIRENTKRPNVVVWPITDPEQLVHFFLRHGTSSIVVVMDLDVPAALLAAWSQKLADMQLFFDPVWLLCLQPDEQHIETRELSPNREMKKRHLQEDALTIQILPDKRPNDD